MVKVKYMIEMRSRLPGKTIISKNDLMLNPSKFRIIFVKTSSIVLMISGAKTISMIAEKELPTIPAINTIGSGMHKYGTNLFKRD